MRSKDSAEFRRQGKAVLAKIRKQVLKDYLVHPLLSGPSAPTTLAANIVANLAAIISQLSGARKPPAEGKAA